MSKKIPKKILALDIGESRIGVAVSDEMATQALPLCVIPHKNRDKDIKAIKILVQEQKAEMIVLGLPKKSATELGEKAEKIIRFGKRLAKVLEVEVDFVDEFETTVEALDVLLMADVSRQKRRRSVDKLAASIILRRYLDGRE